MTDNMKPVRCGCGGKAEAYEIHFWGKCYVCECMECGVTTKPMDTEAEAVQAWNRAMGAKDINVPDKERMAKMEWIPFTQRELTEEEREIYPEGGFVFTCQLPKDGEEILITNGKYVWVDTFYNDGECYFEVIDDVDDFTGYAWMPMPEPYKGK